MWATARVATARPGPSIEALLLLVILYCRVFCRLRLTDNTRWNPNNQCSSGHIVIHDGTSSSASMLTYRYGSNQHCVTADGDSITNDGWVFSYPIIITG